MNPSSPAQPPASVTGKSSVSVNVLIGIGGLCLSLLVAVYTVASVVGGWVEAQQVEARYENEREQEFLTQIKTLIEEVRQESKEDDAALLAKSERANDLVLAEMKLQNNELIRAIAYSRAFPLTSIDMSLWLKDFQAANPELSVPDITHHPIFEGDLPALTTPGDLNLSQNP